MKRALRDLNLSKIILRLIEADDKNSPEELEHAFHILINLSSQEYFQDEFLSINATHRISRLFLAKVDKEFNKSSVLPEDNLFTLDLGLDIQSNFGEMDLDMLGKETQSINSHKDDKDTKKYQVKKSQ